MFLFVLLMESREFSSGLRASVQPSVLRLIYFQCHNLFKIKKSLYFIYKVPFLTIVSVVTSQLVLPNKRSFALSLCEVNGLPCLNSSLMSPASVVAFVLFVSVSFSHPTSVNLLSRESAEYVVLQKLHVNKT